MKKQLTDGQIRFVVLALIVLGVALLRVLLKDLPNVSPLAAIALFGAVYFRNKAMALAVPLIALFITDLFLGFHGTMAFVYGSFVLIGILGLTLRDKIRLLPVTLTALGASTIFFIVTNFGVWLGTTYYPKTLAGLASCYTAGIPFFHLTILGDLFFVGVLFGGFALLKQRFPVLAKA